MHFLILRAVETRRYQISADEVQTGSVTSGNQRRSSLSRPQTASISPANNDGYAPTAEELDPDAHTGDKGPNTHWVHGENIEIAVNI